LTNSLTSVLRPNEPLFRFGGEEFLLLMQCPSREAAAIAAKRIVEQARNSPMSLEHTDKPITMTVTMGVTRVQQGESLDAVVDRADQALYTGKRSGRDCYVMLED
jgi:diguanylate cyclase (GGDEF)-like protein